MIRYRNGVGRRNARGWVWWLALGAGLACAQPIAHAGGATARMQLGYTVANQRAALVEAALEDAEARLDQLESILRAQGLEAGSGQLPMVEANEAIARLRGRLEEVQFEMSSLRGDLEAYQIGQERRQLHGEARLAQIEAFLGLQEPPPPAIAGVPPATPERGGDALAPAPSDDAESEDPAANNLPSDEADAPAVAMSVRDRLSLAESRMEAGHQSAARAILDAALREAETDSPDMVPELRYRRAETLFNEEEWIAAARGFQTVYESHPDSDWAPPAMLRIGECYEGMGRSDDARVFFDGVTRKYSGTEAAREARKKLGR